MSQRYLIAIDLDGTLLNEAKEITPLTRSIFRVWPRQGIVWLSPLVVPFVQS